MPEVCLILMNFNKLLGRSHPTDKSAVGADYELSKMNQDTPKGHEFAVGADLSCAPPIYRPMRTPDYFVHLHYRPTGLDSQYPDVIFKLHENHSVSHPPQRGY